MCTPHLQAAISVITAKLTALFAKKVIEEVQEGLEEVADNIETLLENIETHFDQQDVGDSKICSTLWQDSQEDCKSIQEEEESSPSVSESSEASESVCSNETPEWTISSAPKKRQKILSEEFSVTPQKRFHP